MSNDAKRLEEIEARAAAATPGPWNTQAWGDWFPGQENEQLARSVSHDDDENVLVGGENAIYDAVFIAHAREDVPWLVARVRELEERLADLAYDKNHRD